MRKSVWAGVILAVLALASAARAEKVSSTIASSGKRNVIIFVADGLRYGIVTHDTAPTLADIQKSGVDFRNSHSLYPTITTVNASAIATGHGVGDTGEWGNTMYHGWPPLKAAGGKAVVSMENDAVLKETDQRYGGNYLSEMSLLQLARHNGYQTAAIGKEGPVLIQDIEAAQGPDEQGQGTLIIDDSTHSKKSPDHAVPVTAEIDAAIKAAGLPIDAAARGENSQRGDAQTPGTTVANLVQQNWFRDVTTKVILPKFVGTGRPFAMVYWSRDPDGSQHNNGDSLNKLSPGINGPTSLAAVRNASDNLHALIDALKALGVYDNTDIFVTADHGFSTIGLESQTSYAKQFDYGKLRQKGLMPEGFLAIDMSHALNLPILTNTGAPFDASKGERLESGSRIGADPSAPDIISVSSGGSEVIYLDPLKARVLAPRIVHFLTRQDYVAAVFVDDELGPHTGALPMSAVGLEGKGRTPRPSIYVSFRDYALPSCLATWINPELCSILAANSELQQGQGSHGALTRANTRNFMAAIGPDFKRGFADETPISNADITPTLAHILGFDLPTKGDLQGRVILEALHGGPVSMTSSAQVRRSVRAANGFVTVLETQRVGKEVYLDAAGMPGRVVGLKTLK